MLKPSDYIVTAAKHMDYRFSILSREDAEALHQDVKRKFTGNTEGIIWKNLQISSSLQNERGWAKIDDYLLGRAFILFFDLIEDKTVIELASNTSLTSILENCPGFEFYVTDQRTDYLIAFNHHDFLIGAGLSRGWILSMGGTS